VFIVVFPGTAAHPEPGVFIYEIRVRSLVCGSAF